MPYSGTHATGPTAALCPLALPRRGLLLLSLLLIPDDPGINLRVSSVHTAPRRVPRKSLSGRSTTHDRVVCTQSRPGAGGDPSAHLGATGRRTHPHDALPRRHLFTHRGQDRVRRRHLGAHRSDPTQPQPAGVLAGFHRHRTTPPLALSAGKLVGAAPSGSTGLRSRGGLDPAPFLPDAHDGRTEPTIAPGRLPIGAGPHQRARGDRRNAG